MKTIFHLILVFTMISFCNAQTNEIQNKTKTLPEGVTQEWISNVQDENGKRIAAQSQDSGDAFQTKNFTGFNPGDEFGLSLSSAGDVNGDGFNDIIIGAPYNSGNGSSAGRAYIYYGGLNLNTVPDVILSGNAVNLSFGVSVSTAGDVNGDGYSDVIIGAYGYNNYTGRAYIFFGGAPMNNTQDLIITGENTSDLLGNSVSTAGDVNGDGYSDIIIAAYNYNSTGRAYICFGGSVMNNVPDVIMTGDTIGEQFGASVAGAGDINNDGFSDVIVGANTYNGYTGRAHIFYGGVNMNNISDVTFNGQNANDNFGTAVAFAGDVNGDSYSDIIIGAVGFNGSTGIAYLYLGGSGMDNIADVTINGESTFNYFGNAVSGAGDLNGDGYSDIIIGAPFYSGGKGKAYIFYGSTSMDNVSDMSFTGESVNNYFGSSLASVSDMNGDGFSDILVGAWGINSLTGKAYLYMEGMTGVSFPTLTITGTSLSNLGYSVSSAGDVNGDGYSDIIVGTRYGAYIFFGGINMDNIADLTLSDALTLSISVSLAGDVNGDGYSDVIVGEILNYTSSKAYIYYGGSLMNNVVDVILIGGSANDNFGNSVSTAGDVNGDGYSDVIVGAYDVLSHIGRAYIYNGGSSMDNVSDVILSGEEAPSSFGSSISTAGDVNGDGYSDVIVGDGRYNINTGRAYIYYGSSIMDNTADIVFNGEGIYNYFGNSVSRAGDVNGDGYSDVIIGAYGNEAAGVNTGRSYIYYGGSSMNNISDVIMTGEGTYDNFGKSVSTLGDINGDGYSDVIVSGSDQISIGHIHIFYGGLYMDNVQDISMRGDSTFNYFGSAISSAGDLNGDGNSDFIIGANGYSSFKGRVYIYFSSTPSLKPNLLSVKDIPNDQGGFVKLKWVKSGFDIPVTGTITSYIIERSIPPGSSGFQWEQIGSVLPTQDNLYYYFTSSTPADSGINGNSTFYFRVTAYTGAASTQYRSNIMSGNSIDNIAPSNVNSFSANPVSNNVRLSWNRNHEQDLKNYVLYRSALSTINISTEPVFATITDSTYLDSAPLTGVYYYFIVAQDIHSNKSPVVSSESQNITFNLTAFIEGFYNSSSNDQVSDTLRAYLRNSNAPYAIVDSAKTVLSANGSVTIKFGNAPTGNYYIIFKQRNTIETWSKTGGENLVRGGSSNYDFSNSSSKAFGNNLKQVDNTPNRFAIFSGDVNQDGIVDASDISAVENDAANSLSGYVSSDVTGDDFVDASDISIVENNAASGVSLITP